MAILCQYLKHLGAVFMALIVNLYSVDPNETISTAKYENSFWGEEVELTNVVKPFNCLFSSGSGRRRN